MNQKKKEYSNSNLFYGLNGQSLISPFESENTQFEPKIKLGVLASGNGTNFEYIVKSIESKKTIEYRATWREI